MKKKKFFLVINVDWFFISHFLPIGLEAIRRDYEVTVFSIDTGKRKEIENHGFRFVELPTSRSSMNVFKELRTISILYKYYKKHKPDIIHHFTMKPVLYGSFVNRFLKLNTVVNSITGMGYIFSEANTKKFAPFVALKIFNFVFNDKKLKFIFENDDDKRLVCENTVVDEQQCYKLDGAGVSMEEFDYSEENESDVVKIILPARMLWDKGIGEYVAAAEKLKKVYGSKIEFLLAGGIDDNKAAIPKETLDDWNKDGNVKWLGYQTDMVRILKEAHIVALPSYREGLPKCLIEACAIGRPIVSTLVPGCKDVVDDEVNGFLVAKKDSDDLADKIEKLFLSKELRVKMGKEGRKKAERIYAVEKIVSNAFKIYNS